MASTRNKNTPGNYAAERISSERKHQELMFANAAQGQAYQTFQPGNGLLHGRIAGRNLSENDCDIESFLFGIGSTNLENPQAPITPRFIPLKQVNIMHKPSSVVMPKTLVLETNHRDMYLN